MGFFFVLFSMEYADPKARGRRNRDAMVMGKEREDFVNQELSSLYEVPFPFSPSPSPKRPKFVVAMDPGAAEDWEEIKMFQTLTIPDNIIKAFFRSVSKTLPQMLDSITTFDKKRYVPYQYNSLTYRSTIYNYYQALDDEKPRLTIKLSHDGFRYSMRRFKRANVHHHHSNRFYILDVDLEEEMPYLHSLRTDLRFHPIDDIRTCILMFTFEPGTPEEYFGED